jgi:hypothetical protein
MFYQFNFALELLKEVHSFKIHQNERHITKKVAYGRQTF